MTKATAMVKAKVKANNSKVAMTATTMMTIKPTTISRATATDTVSKMVTTMKVDTTRLAKMATNKMATTTPVINNKDNTRTSTTTTSTTTRVPLLVSNNPVAMASARVVAAVTLRRNPRLSVTSP